MGDGGIICVFCHSPVLMLVKAFVDVVTPASGDAWEMGDTLKGWKLLTLAVKGFCYCCSFVTTSCLTLWDPTDCSPLGSSVHGILQATILKWVVISFSRGSSWSRNQTHISCIGRRALYHWATREAWRILKPQWSVFKALFLLMTQVPGSSGSAVLVDLPAPSLHLSQPSRTCNELLCFLREASELSWLIALLESCHASRWKHLMNISVWIDVPHQTTQKIRTLPIKQDITSASVGPHLTKWL